MPYKNPREIRTVGGRRYNLDTAKVIGTSADATLYKKRNGEFFLHREGSHKIESMIFRDARKWAQNNLTEEEFKAEFEYSDEAQTVTYSLPQYAIEKLRTMAGDRRKQPSQIITDLIMGTLDDVKEQTIETPARKVRLITAQEGADYVGLGVQTFKKWADEIGATKHIGGRAVRYDIEVIDAEIKNMQ